MTTDREALVKRITVYLTEGGLFNPELAIHDNMRDLLIDCRAALSAQGGEQTADTVIGKLCQSCAEEAARICETLSFATEIGELMQMTKADMACRACVKCAEAIRAAAKEGKS